MTTTVTRPPTSRPLGLLAVPALYLGLVIWLTWPLAGHIATHLPDTPYACNFDTLFSAWVLAYESHVLTTAPSHLLEANIYHPAADTLFYGPTGFGSLPYFLPTFLLTHNPALALNLTFVGCVALTASALHFVVLRWSESHLGGLVAGWSFLTTRWILWEGLPTFPTLAALLYFPVIIFLAAKTVPSRSRTLGLLLLVIFQCLTDFVYFAPAVLAPLGVLCLAYLARRATRRAGLHLAGVLLLTAVALSPGYAAYNAVRSANPNLYSQTLWPLKQAQRSTVLPWGPLGVLSPTAVPPAALLVIPIGLLSFALRRRSGDTGEQRQGWTHGAFWAGCGILMSLTPTVYWAGEPVRLPHAALMELVPPYQSLRVPSRLGVAGLMGLSILAGLGFAECARRVSGFRRATLVGSFAKAGLAAAVIAGTYAQYAHSMWLPSGILQTGLKWARAAGLSPVLQRSPLPAVYPIAPAPTIPPESPLLSILQEPGGPLLELPPGANVPKAANRLALPCSHARAMYRSIFHWRPLLNGYSSYWPAGFLKRMELADRLPAPEALATLRHETDLESILVHTASLGGAVRQVWLSLAARGGRGDLRLIARDGDDLLFTVVDRESP